MKNDEWKLQLCALLISDLNIARRDVELFSALHVWRLDKNFKTKERPRKWGRNGRTKTENPEKRKTFHKTDWHNDGNQRQFSNPSPINSVVTGIARDSYFCFGFQKIQTNKKISPKRPINPESNKKRKWNPQSKAVLFVCLSRFLLFGTFLPSVMSE